MVRNAASASLSIHVRHRPSVRRHMWWYSRECVRGGLIGRGFRLRHPTSAVPRTSGLADVAKLYKYGTRGPTLERSKSYLSNRQQYVQIHKTKSDTKPITCGIPQYLGPLLFIIYINDLAQVSEVLFTILFADDTTVTIQGDNESVLINTLNIEFEKLNIWLQANKWTINVSKSHYMIFHRRRRKIDISNPSLNNTVLQRVNYTKFLGVIINDGLK